VSGNATGSIADLVQAYRRELLASGERMNIIATSASAFERIATAESGLVGRPPSLGRASKVTFVPLDPRVCSTPLLMAPGVSARARWLR
jgi:hypothetical protein